MERTAERHGVNPKRLAWWRWSLRREEARPRSVKLLPVVVESSIAAPASVTWLEIVAAGVAIRAPIGTDVGYVAALVAAVRSTC